jgi:putative oxidoreductase
MASTERFANFSDVVVLLARLILALVFLLAFVFKVMGMGMIAEVIRVAGFPFPMLLAVLAAVLEIALVVSLLTGVCFSQLMLAGFVYVVFLAFSFHGPSHWTDPKGLEFGAFVDHFPFAAALLFAMAHGPGRRFVLGRASR